MQKYTIYKVTNLINNKIYIGKHETNNTNDNYYGSGKHIKRAIKKYGKHNFKKEVLFIFDNEDDMVAKEIELVTEEFCDRLDNYNQTPGGKGGFGYINKNNLGNTFKLIKQKSNKMKEYWTEEKKKEKSDDMKEYFLNNDLSKELSIKMKERHSDPIFKEKFKQKMKKVVSKNDYKNKMKTSLKESWREGKFENRKSIVGMRWFNNGKETKKSYVLPGDGWCLGRILSKEHKIKLKKNGRKKDETNKN
jgi:hypothetical protein